MKKIGFLFDLDGTLVNSQEAVMNSWITMANEAGIPLEEYLFFIVVPMAAIMTIEGVTTVKPHWRKDEFGQ